MKTFKISCAGKEIELGPRTLIMGVLNITPDSFSDGGEFFSAERAVAQGLEMADRGADIVDIGGESTRPFADKVSEDEEIGRVIPVIEKLAKKLDIPISVDTAKSGVARRALDAGASIINDISALRFDPQMAVLAAERGVPVVLMHMRGTPETMQIDPEYQDLFGEIGNFFTESVNHAVSKGISRSQLIIDPGIGFGKTVTHNLLLIQRLSEFGPLDLPILVGSSRKAFIRNLLKPDNAGDIDPQLPEVETGTQASVAAAAMNGANIVRVHNVANTAATLKIVDAIKNASPT